LCQTHLFDKLCYLLHPLVSVDGPNHHPSVWYFYESDFTLNVNLKIVLFEIIEQLSLTPAASPRR